MNPSEIESIILLKNNSPREEFCGLTPNEMNRLLYDSFGEKSPLSFCSAIDNSLLDQIPFFRLSEEFAKLIQREKQIKLTPLGALTKKVMVELYDFKFIGEYLIERGISKLWKEEDSLSIMTVRYNIQMAGIVKKSSGKLSLTKLGERLLKPENRFDFFKTIFITYSNEFNWSVSDGYPEAPIGQLGFGYTLYLLEKFGHNQKPANFYAEKYLAAFPKFLSYFSDRELATKQKSFQNCYIVRTFDRFLEWFGLVTIEKDNYSFTNNENVMPTQLFRQIFKFE